MTGDPRPDDKPYFTDTGTVMLALMMGREIKIGGIRYRLLRTGNKAGSPEDGGQITAAYTGIYAKSADPKVRWVYSEFKVGMFIDFIDKHLDTCQITA